MTPTSPEPIPTDQWQPDERFVVVGVIPSPVSGENLRAHRQALAEMESLLEAARAECLEVIEVRPAHLHAGTLISRIRAERIASHAKAMGATGLAFDADLSPAQQSNLERLTGLKVTTRPEVILDIFARRAQTREGKIQVELAQLRYLLPRLKRQWLHLERQRGGIGLRGPGETQLETDRRRLRDRIAHLERDLERVIRHRETQRRARQRSQVPLAALVGYTNAGKSTLFNCLTDARAHVEDQVFATLDPTVRRTSLPGGQPIVVSDTVGFISRTPPTLFAAFRATLEETRHAALIIHVVDATSADIPTHLATTDQVLEDLGLSETPLLTVWNKVDIADEVSSDWRRWMWRRSPSLAISAKTGAGIAELRRAMAVMLEVRDREITLRLPHERYDVVARLHAVARVVQVLYTHDEIRIRALVPPGVAFEFESRDQLTG
ncbi:GTPase HflX [Candidatus Sumerlaeota bacterium]|nr:GTPase HflX [Candidatus Sumerlaeota bacterium]